MSRQTKFPKYKIHGVEIDALTMPQAINYITQTAADPASPATYIVKPYVEFLDHAYRNQDLINLLNAADLSIPDGVALSWATTYLYATRHGLWPWILSLTSIIFKPKTIHRLLPERAAGINFTWPLLETACRQNLRIFLIGTPNHGKGDINDVATAIRHRLPTINLVGQYGGFFPPGNQNQLKDALLAAKPDVVLVGMGFPRQERLMATLVSQLPHGVLIGEGGTFDYHSFGGHVPKAPRLLQTIGLEWFWRLVLEPARLRRQLAIPRFIWRIYLEGRKFHPKP